MATKHRKAAVGSSAAGRAVAFAEAVEDRRDTPRLRLPPVKAEIVSLGLRVTILEVGFGGLSIESEHEFAVGETHDLRYGTLNEEPVVLTARVKHSRLMSASRRSPRYVTGFQFVDPWCPGDRSPLDEFISRVTIGLSSGGRT